MALWFPTFSTWLGRPGIWLEDLFVRPEHRGKGYGLALLQHLRTLTDGRIEWAVLDWNSRRSSSTTPSGARPVLAGPGTAGRRLPTELMAVIDIAGYVAELKDHAVDHGFHVHDERHFVETYSLRQAWEVDLHPEEGCGGPLDLHLALEVDPRVLLAFEDLVVDLPDDDDPPDEFHFPLTFTWALPPLPHGPDLLAAGAPTSPASAASTCRSRCRRSTPSPSATDAPERRITVIARQQVSLARVLAGEELLCDVFDRCLAVSQYLLEQAPAWLDD